MEKKKKKKAWCSNQARFWLILCRCECTSIPTRQPPHAFLMLPCPCVRACCVYAELMQPRTLECVPLQVSQRRYAWRLLRPECCLMHNLSAVCHSFLIHTSLSKATLFWGGGIMYICYSVHVLVLIMTEEADKRRRGSVWYQQARPGVSPTSHPPQSSLIQPRVAGHHCRRSQLRLTRI